MNSSITSSRRVRAGLFEINLSSGEVHKNGHKVALQEQPFRVLALLLERPGEIIPREEVQSRLWPADTFVGFDEGINTAIRKLRIAFGDSADNPRFIQTIPRRGYRFLAPVHESTSESSQPSEIVVVDSTREESRRSPGDIWLWFVPLAAAGLVVLASLLFVRRSQPPSSVAAISVPKPRVRKSVAVLSFRNASKREETAWLSNALPDMFSTELSAGEKLRVIPSETTARMKRDLSLGDTDTLAADTLKRVRSYIGGDLILVGSYTTLGKASGGQVRLDVRLQDATTGETVASVAETGSEINLFDLVSRVGSDLRRRLAIGETDPVEAAGVQASYPTTAEAARLYTQGLSELRLLDSRRALGALQRAVSADPKFPLTHYALALAWTGLGFDEKAKEEAKLAFELSGNLSREDRLLVEARYREMTQDWPVAIQVYRNLVNFFPDTAEYGLRLANAQSRSGKIKDALATIAALRTLPPPQNSDPRIDLQQAYAMQISGDSQGMLTASTAAANEAAAQGSRFVEARARLSEGTAEYRLGDKEKALAAWEESRQIWASAGYTGEVAKTMINTGNIFQERGNLPDAKKRYEEALSIWRTSGNKLGQMNALANLADLETDEGDLAGAKQMNLESLVIAREVHATPDVAGALCGLGDNQLALGDAAGALVKDREAVDLARQFGGRGALAEILARTSRAFYFEGDLRSAEKSVQEAADIARQIKNKSHIALAMTNWGEILMAEGDLPGARKKFEEALQIRTEIEQKSNAAATRLQLAALSIEEGRAADAEPVARAVRDEYRREGHPDDELGADAVLLRALYTENKLGEAEKEAGDTKSLLARSQSIPYRLAITTIVAQIRAASGKPAEALQDLSIATHDAAKSGFAFQQLESRLAHADVELKSGKSLTAHAELTALKKDAAATGFGLVVKKANVLTDER